MAATILSKIFSNRRTSPDMALDTQSTHLSPAAPGPTSHPSVDDLARHNPSSRHRTPRTSAADVSEMKVADGDTRSTSRQRRKSYDSVREQSDVPQSFTKYARKPSDAEPADPSGEWERVGRDTPVAVIRRDHGRRKSNSLSHLPRLGKVDLDHYPTMDEESAPVRDTSRTLAPFEDLPVEILENILGLLASVSIADEFSSRYADLISCLQVSRTLNEAGLNVLYKNIAIPHSIIFSKFMASLHHDPKLGELVRRLDFSRYSNMGFGRTRRASAEILNVTPVTLAHCLDLMPKLKEFLVHEHVDDELDVDVLNRVLSKPSIEALDFCACSSAAFTKAFADAINTAPAQNSALHSLKRLSLHECTSLQAPVFENLMPQLARITHLDVAHTMITDDALLSIPPTARLTHVNFGRCTQLTGAAVVRFLTTHPAAKDSLVFVNLMADASRYRLLSEAELSTLLPRLPDTLRSLNIGGARVNSTHLPALLPLTRHVEELGLAASDLSMEQLESFFAPELGPCALRYLDLSHVKDVTQVTLNFSKHCLTSRYSQKLEVVELGESVLEQIKKRNKNNRDPDWVVRELGRRGWYVRQHGRNGESEVDDGRRTWKMGARWWGMRKLPVAVQEVGGMYGFYAFKRI